MLFKGLVFFHLYLDSWNFIFGLNTGFQIQHHFNHVVDEVHQLWYEQKQFPVSIYLGSEKTKHQSVLARVKLSS